MFNKKSILAAAVAGLFISTTASAAVVGPYVGAQLGWGNIHQNGFSHIAGATTSSNSDTNTGVAGRLFGGYEFTKYVAAELGYTKFSNGTYKQTGTFTGGTYKLNATIKTYAVDLVAKGIIPLESGFSIYGKLGAAYLNESASASGSITGITVVRGSSSASKVLPIYGVGATYDINQNVSADVSWTRIQKTGNTNLQNVDFASFGLAYHFS